MSGNNLKTKKPPNLKWKRVKGPKPQLKNKTTALVEEIHRLTEKYNQIDVAKVEKFEDFPLSSKTKKGLENGKYVAPTEIQKQSIGLAIKENDILGAAKTGSGKTLAFLIPVLERLFVQKWTPMDGLGALIISPTRELAYQIFGVLRVVGKFHDFSAGLVIGGKNLREEAEKINNTNIIICTPGRLLQHMDETFNFSADNLQILVLDEADRILDLGFQDTMNAIIQNLPPNRQTLLFSATQTKSVKDLARLSLNDPMYVSVHENATHSTPTHLTQSYVACQLHDKLDMLWSFIRNHLRMKVLVFLSSCKQVRFVYEVFRRMRPGVSILCLHGAMQQMKRVAVYEGFKKKKHAVLLATDIAARGLDFPAVHWVIQLDCPEDANTYIHRVGRTARYEKNGEALLVLLPSELKMIEHLEAKKIPIEKIEINKEKLQSIQGKIEAHCASDVELKQYAQRGFMSYLKAMFYMKDKKVFDVTKVDTDSYARSMGLAIAPRIRFLERQGKQTLKKEVDISNINQNKVTSKSTNENKINPSNKVENGSPSDGDSDMESPLQNEDAILGKLKRQQKVQKTQNESESGSSDSDSSESGDESDSSNGAANKKRLSTKLKSKDRSTKDAKSKMKKQVQPEVTGFDADIADDDDDDLFTVKKVDVSVLEEENKNEEDGSSNKKKSQSKAALAKKVLKKNIVVNEKIVFDDEGEEMQRSKNKPGLAEEDGYEGGINIKEAQKRMKEEDLKDKQVEKERIKQKHKEKKMKLKESQRKKPKQESPGDEEEPIAVLGDPGSDVESGAEWISEESGESGSEAGCQSSEEGSAGSQSEESESEDEGPRAKKSKKSTAKHKGGIAYDAGVSIEDDEMMALHLLSGGL